MKPDADSNPPPLIGALEHLTGPSRGSMAWCNHAALDVLLTASRHIVVSPTTSDDSREGLVARIRQTEEGFEIDTVGEGRVWINGKPVARARIGHHDIIEFGENGPLSRLFIHGDGEVSRKSVGDTISDAIAYFRASRRPFLSRLGKAFGLALRRLTRETTLLFRIGVVIAICALAAVTYQQYRMNALLRQQIETSAGQLEAFARTLVRTREEALTAGDLAALRQELGKKGLRFEERLAELERRSGAGARVIARTSASVAFMQGSYSFRQKTTKRMLRLAVDKNGKPLVTPWGQPVFTLEGDGPVAERKFTGTAFAVADGGTLLTNRHVTHPWETDANIKLLEGQNLEPVMIRLIAYLPGKVEAHKIEVIRVDEKTDLALVRYVDGKNRLKPLPLAAALPSIGDGVIVMGYPTGLRSMLAQAGEAFVQNLQKTKTTGFWEVAAELAKMDRIVPLASQGIVSQVSEETVVFDAETTSGGSGGPVLALDGSVVAVNTAIMPQFGGSNIGIPAAKIRLFLESPVAN